MNNIRKYKKKKPDLVVQGLMESIGHSGLVYYWYHVIYM